MYACATRSSSSVVTPTATALPASASAPAAMRLATRIFSMTSGVCTHGSLPSWAVALPTYSGRAMNLGTASVGETTPGLNGARTDILSVYSGPPPQPAQPGPATRAADVQRPADDPAGEHHVRAALGRGVLAVVVGAADVDLHVVDRGAGPAGQTHVDPADPHIELDDDDRAGEPRPGQIQIHRAHPSDQRQPGGHHPLPVPFERARPTTQLQPVGGRRGDRPGPGQIVDQGIEFGAHPRVRDRRGALLELVDGDQSPGHRAVRWEE